MWFVVAVSLAKPPVKAKPEPAPNGGVTLIAKEERVLLPHAIAFRRPGSQVWTVAMTAERFTCAELREDGWPSGSHVQIEVGPALKEDGSEPWIVLGTYLAHGGGSGFSSEDGPPATWADGVAMWTAPIPLPMETGELAPGTVKPVDCGEVPLAVDTPVFAPSKTATWRVAGKPLVVGGARVQPNGSLELSTDGASCAWGGGADVTLALSPDGASVELAGGRLPTLFASPPDPTPVAWSAPARTGERVTVTLAGKFALDNGYTIELGGTVDAFDCRAE